MIVRAWGRWPLGAVLAAVVLAVVGCGEDGPLSSGNADDVIEEWADVACGTATVRTYTGAELAAMGTGTSDIELRGVCERDDVTGTLIQKRQVMTVYESDSALDVHLSGLGCDSGVTHVNSSQWVAETAIEEIATDLVEAGGELTC